VKEFTPDRMWEMDFNGTWQVVSSPDFEDDYLNVRVPAHVTLRRNGDFARELIRQMCGAGFP
jgi:hypothetical protein